MELENENGDKKEEDVELGHNEHERRGNSKLKDDLIQELHHLSETYKLASINHKKHEKFFGKINVSLDYPATLMIAIATILGALQARSAAEFDPYNISIFVMNAVATMFSLTITFWQLGNKRDQHAKVSGQYQEMQKTLGIYISDREITEKQLRERKLISLNSEQILDEYELNLGAMGCVKVYKSLDEVG